MRLLRRRHHSRAVPRVWEIPERGLMFVHVPKVATRSMRVALATWLGDSLGAGETDEDALEALAVERYERFAEPAQIRKRETATFAFAFVRDPLDRLYSAYADKVVGERAKGIFGRHGVGRDTTFAEFVRIVCEISDDQSDRHLCSQHRFVCDTEGVVVDYIGRFERLEEDWSSLRDRFDLPALPVRNVASTRDYRDVYTSELARRVAERYRTDIELFGYGDRVEPLIS